MISDRMALTTLARLAVIAVFSVWSKYDVTDICHESLLNSSSAPYSASPIMMNRAALDLLQDASLEAGAIEARDWWIYQMITGVGGKVIFDQEQSLYYRQHGGNLIGANVGTAALLTRTRMVASGRFSEWNDINIAALRRSAHRFTPENQRRLALFARARRRRGIARLNDLQKVGVYRQTKFSNAAMWSAIALGKI
ncbi:hypothetical protein [Falsihalocynthiibacter arcticus]|uniref:Uncharacterized protein n=1 Tax=Falsihalocynthiibacter arcticus TaxID=1579316 RepID=A0A126UY01_9RHOB|nr:hypothetical protein [Falsihalocynthiibacter arcticus]AML50953.1 hypothetical protein RC74_06400 [Falsihalocynthiibacter arcticus]